jgi:hypothetical protein
MPKTRKIKHCTPCEKFVADLAPNYEDVKRKSYNPQGLPSFLDEFHTLYRRWVKNE